MSTSEKMIAGLSCGAVAGLVVAAPLYALDHLKNHHSEESIVRCQAELGSVAVKNTGLPDNCVLFNQAFNPHGTYDLPAAADLPKVVSDFEASTHHTTVRYEELALVVLPALGLVGGFVAGEKDKFVRPDSAPEILPEAL